jgi:Sulfotransferase domain
VKTKVFGIGFHKTGTTSLAKALTILGYRVTGPNGVDDPEIAQNVYAMAFGLAEKFDAFQDNPWPILYRELDKEFPNSKFVLTIRPTTAWIKSIENHFAEEDTPMRKWIYGVGHPRGNETIYIDRYERHNREVVGYFAGRDKDLLIMDVTRGEGWEKLCQFLREPIPSVSFPCANTASIREVERKRESSWVWRTRMKVERRAKTLLGSRLSRVARPD